MRRAALLEHIEECLKLNNEYQSCFKRMREKLRETPEEKQFDFSESYIFGKFDLFAKRLERIADVVTVVAAYAPVLDIRLEGIETIQTRYKLLFETIRKRNYDMTDIRRTEVPLTHMPSVSMSVSL